MHSLNEGHGLFMSLSTGITYILPDDMEVDDSDQQLSDIKNAIYPIVSQEDIDRFDHSLINQVDVHGRNYNVGYLGLVNTKANDYANVVIQLLTHLEPIRNLFLSTDLRGLPDIPFAAFLKSSGLLTRKLFNICPLKLNVSPHELLQAIRTASNERFKVIKQGDPIELLAWLLNTLERALVLANLPAVTLSLKGQLRVLTRKVFFSNERQLEEFYDMVSDRVDSKTAPFYFLTLDLPPTPLFQDPTGKNSIPQIHISELLQKYDGIHVTNKADSELTYTIIEYPRFLVVHIKRILKSEFGMEKKRTVVSFPVKDLHVGPHKYDLLANISHEGDAENGRYFCHLRHKATESWSEVRDTEIRPIHPSTIFLNDSYIQVWEQTQ